MFLESGQDNGPFLLPAPIWVIIVSDNSVNGLIDLAQRSFIDRAPATVCRVVSVRSLRECPFFGWGTLLCFGGWRFVWDSLCWMLLFRATKEKL